MQSRTAIGSIFLRVPSPTRPSAYREIGLSLWCAEYVTDHVQVAFEPLLGGVIDVDIHECEVIASAGSPVIACASRYRGKRGRWPVVLASTFLRRRPDLRSPRTV